MLSIVARSEKKPLRVFLQDGRNDNRGQRPGGEYNANRDWFYQNVRLLKALTAKGYEVNYSWGIGRHGQKQGGAIRPCRPTLTTPSNAPSASPPSRSRSYSRNPNV